MIEQNQELIPTLFAVSETSNSAADKLPNSLSRQRKLLTNF